jgi:hypothetical protein
MVIPDPTQKPRLLLLLDSLLSSLRSGFLSSLLWGSGLLRCSGFLLSHDDVLHKNKLGNPTILSNSDLLQLSSNQIELQDYRSPASKTIPMSVFANHSTKVFIAAVFHSLSVTTNELNQQQVQL